MKLLLTNLFEKLVIWALELQAYFSLVLWICRVLPKTAIISVLFTGVWYVLFMCCKLHFSFYPCISQMVYFNIFKVWNTNCSAYECIRQLLWAWLISPELPATAGNRYAQLGKFRCFHKRSRWWMYSPDFWGRLTMLG